MQVVFWDVHGNVVVVAGECFPSAIPSGHTTHVDLFRRVVTWDVPDDDEDETLACIPFPSGAVRVSFVF